METTATTRDERQPRISALINAFPTPAVQGLLELAANTVEAIGEGDLPPGSFELACEIRMTQEPEAPGYEVGEQVAREGVTLGKVTDRYLNEEGEWEYQVRLGKPYNTTQPYPESELDGVGDLP